MVTKFMDLLKHYRNIQYHRSMILEGIRTAALRNMTHMSRVMEQLGIPDLSSEESTAAVQNQMLKDQGMEPTDFNRYVISRVKWQTWEVYLCVLYAEIEYYENNRQIFEYQALDDFCSAEQLTIHNLRELRDKLLHPSKTVTHEALNAFAKSTNPYSFVFRAQDLIDDYIVGLRSTIAQHAQLGGEGDNAEDVLGYQLPDFKRYLQTRATLLQTSEQLPLWIEYMQAAVDFSKTRTVAKEHPAFIQRAKIGSIDLTGKSQVLLSEFFALLKEELPSLMLQANTLNQDLTCLSRALIQEEISRQAQSNLAALTGTSAALLVEPLRLYQQAAQSYPELNSLISIRYPETDLLNRCQNIET